MLGLVSGDAADRFLVGLATLTLLCEVAEDQPLICVVDDAQWLDQPSARMLVRGPRLGAEPLGMVFGTRQTDEESKLAGLPDLVVRGLDIDDAAVVGVGGARKARCPGA